MTANVGPHRNAASEPEAVALGQGSRPERQARAASRKRRMIVLGVELDALLCLLRNRRFQQTVITGIIGLAALARLAKESHTHGIARLAAWDKKQDLRRQRNARP
jgi:hypothetical protein